MAAKAKYLFRGTTINFEGGRNSKENAFTCTTKHPVIALFFAMDCANHYPDEAVVYIARLDKVEHLKAESNVLKKLEQEFVVGVAPTEFYQYTEGYVHFKDLQNILGKMGFGVFEVVRKEKLSELCRKVKPVKAKEWETLMQQLKIVMKTH